MYCDSCGKEIVAGARFCAACGKAIAGGVPGPGQRRVSQHIQVVAILWLVASVLRLLGGFAALFAGTLFLPRLFSGFGWPLDRLVPGVVSGIAMALTIVALVGLAAGWGLLQREPWARGLTLVLAVIALLHFPLGTALGIYTLWVLLPQESAREYSQLVRHA